jgi:hypothetical protein
MHRNARHVPTVLVNCGWEARIGRGAGGRPAAGGRKYTYLGLYDTEIEAAMAYDRAAVKLRGLAAITNFDLSMYLDELNPGEGVGVLRNISEIMLLLKGP